LDDHGHDDELENENYMLGVGSIFEKYFFEHLY
jgi:hypothetical protein